MESPTRESSVMKSTTQDLPLISADNEWSPLKVAIVGRAEHSAFPSEPPHMITATMPSEHHASFKWANPFPPDIVEKAQLELDNLACVLKAQGVRVIRPRKVNWLKEGGYTGAMPRDCLMTVGNTLVESPFAWSCRRREVELAYSDIVEQLSSGGSSRICRAPLIVGNDTIYDGLKSTTSDTPKTDGHTNNANGHSNGGSGYPNGATEHSNAPDEQSNGVHRRVNNPAGRSYHHWAINNSRPAFDTADFMRLGTTIVGQLSNVTNRKGVQYLQAVIPDDYTVEILDTNDEHAMHIDATILPLRDKLLVYNPLRLTEKELRRHKVFAGWDLHPYPFTPQPRVAPPMYMCSPWLVLNALSIDGRRILMEENDTDFAAWLEEKFGMEPILCPLQHVHCLGGSFHCATVDLVRLPS